MTSPVRHLDGIRRADSASGVAMRVGIAGLASHGVDCTFANGVGNPPNASPAIAGVLPTP